MDFVIRNLYLQGLQPGAKVTVTSLLLLTGNSSTTVEYIDFKIDHALHRASGGFRKDFESRTKLHLTNSSNFRQKYL